MRLHILAKRLIRTCEPQSHLDSSVHFLPSHTCPFSTYPATMHWPGNFGHVGERAVTIQGPLATFLFGDAIVANVTSARQGRPATVFTVHEAQRGSRLGCTTPTPRAINGKRRLLEPFNLVCALFGLPDVVAAPTARMQTAFPTSSPHLPNETYNSLLNFSSEWPL
jgi:hypothetical protein